MVYARNPGITLNRFGAAQFVILAFIQNFVNTHREYLKLYYVEASSIGDTFPLKRAVKGRCGDFRSKAKKILPDLDCGSLSV